MKRVSPFSSLAALCCAFHISVSLYWPPAFPAPFSMNIPITARCCSAPLHDCTDDGRQGLHGMRHAVYSDSQILIRCHEEGSHGSLPRRLVPLQISRWM